MDIYSPIKFFGTASTALLRTGLKILQHGIITQSAYNIEPKLDSTSDKVVTCEQAVSYKDVRDIEQLFLMFGYRPKAHCRLIVVVVLHMFKVERCATFRRVWNCLYREKESCIADTGGNLSETENIETPFYNTGTSRPVPVKSGSLRAVPSTGN